MKTVAVVAVAVSAAVGCAGSTRSAEERPHARRGSGGLRTSPELGPAACASLPCETTDAKQAAPSAAAPNTVTPSKNDAAPAATGLARGTGTASDRALSLADAAYDNDDLKVALRHYSDARRLAPRDPAPPTGLVRVKLADSDVPNEYAAAPGHPLILRLLTEIDAAIKLDPAYAPARIERGRLLLILGRPEDALRALEQAARLVPGDAEAQSALAVALIATGQTEQALQHFRRSVELDPNNADRLTNLGTAYMMRGKVGEAIAVYRRAVALRPDDARSQGDLGTAYLAQNRPEKALPHLRRAVELAPDQATHLSNLGYAYQRQAALDLAISTYKKAINKDERLGSAWINLGTALVEKGQYDEAEKAFQKALSIDATDPRAQQNLEELRQLRLKQGGGKAK